MSAPAEALAGFIERARRRPSRAARRLRPREARTTYVPPRIESPARPLGR